MCDVAPPPAITDEPGARELTLLAEVDEIPGLAEQPTSHGVTIGTLFPYEGRIFFGYGDYNDNTGPIEMVAYVVAEDAFETHGAISTEEVQRFTVHDGALYTADVDPKGHQASGSVFRLDAPCGHFETMTAISGAVHTYALLEFEGDLWVGTGSVSAKPAFVASSSDGGVTWKEELAIESASDVFTRVLDGGVNGDELFISGRSFPSAGDTNFAMHRVGGEWKTISGVPDQPRVVPIELGDQFAVVAFSSDVGKGGSFKGGFGLEGNALEPREWFPAGFVLVNWTLSPAAPGEDPRLWALGRQGGGFAVIASGDFQDWETVAELPALARGEPRSIAYDANRIFLGTDEGDLYAIEEIYSPEAG